MCCEAARRNFNRPFVILCLCDAGMLGTFPSGQAVFVNPKVCIYAQSKLFQKIVDFCTIFNVCSNYTGVCILHLPGTSEIDLSGIHI